MAPAILAQTVDASVTSNTEAFRKGVDQRDGPACVVCEYRVPNTLDYCYIVPKSDLAAWEQLRLHHWIPAAAKSVEHECRNGVIMCKNHLTAFHNFQYFVRFVPERKEYVFYNFLNHREYIAYHNLPLRLDPNHVLAPFPMAFLWQERIARARYPGDAALTLTPPHERSSPTTQTQAPLPEADLVLWTSPDYWRAQGYRNWDSISQEDEENDGVRE
ncbi:hypothetical protein K440DRAFT_576510 [Wilcoxina mikolae CBS 423.85]|nr:hypothetical protein K440DRAFT_576510 [Wilcoxina mikolae CBS 423.85]